MPSTSAHLPQTLLRELDLLASERRVSRNRLIVEACREMVRKRREWPSSFFDDRRFTDEDLADLRASAQGFADQLASARSSRETAPF